jgi:lipopolysaccharide export system protein LptA
VTVTFDKQAKPQPQHAVFAGGVHLIERTRLTENVREPWSVRDLTTDQFVAVLAPAVIGTDAQLRNAEANGNAHLIVVNNGTVANTAGQGRTELAADVLKAALIPSADSKQAPQLDTIVGRGHTVLHQVTANGVDQTSMGDTLDAKFKPVTAASRRSNTAEKTSPKSRQDNEFGVDRLWSSVQQGHVTMARRSPAKKEGGRDEAEGATAERARFDGDLNRLTLAGGVKLTNSGSVLWANQVELDRATGDAHATGSVKVNYDSAQTERTPPAGGRSQQVEEPTHIVADRAEMEHATDTATFYGKPVRLWQGASQIQAPVVELSRTQKRLIARGETSAGSSGTAQTPQVHTLLASTGSDARSAGTSAGTGAGVGAAGCGPAKPGAAKASAGSASGAAQVVRIASGGLTYSGVSRQAEFTGGVRADTVDATIRASQATGYLQQRGSQPQATDATIPSLAGS